MHKKAKQSIGAILTTDGGDETFDIELAQANMKQKHRDRKQAQGTSTDIFNTSSYGNVKMQQFLAQAKQRDQGQKSNVSVSMVEMQDSMQFDNEKDFKKGLGAQKGINGTIESRSPGA